jgi:CpXC protein
MSSFANADLTCPKCKKGFSTTYWTSVNVTIDPHFRHRIFDGSIHHQECPHCNQGISIQTPLLYHDTTHRFMVFFEAERPDRPITWNTKFLEDSVRLLPNTNIVS